MISLGGDCDGDSFYLLPPDLPALRQWRGTQDGLERIHRAHRFEFMGHQPISVQVLLQALLRPCRFTEQT